MHNQDNTQHLIAELNILARNLEALLDVSADITEDKLALIRNNALDALHNAKSVINHYGADIISTTKNTVDCIDGYVRNNPWQSVGIGAAIGAILANLLASK